MLQTTQGRKTVVTFDPAIRTKVPPNEMVKFTQTRDFSIVEKYIDPKDPPMIYHFNLPSRNIQDRVIGSMVDDEGRACAAFQCCIIQVDNMRQKDGARLKWNPTGNPAIPGIDAVILTDKEMTLFSRAEQYEVGSVIRTAAFLPWWIGGGYQLPRTLSEQLGVLEVQSVDASPSTAPPNNSRPSNEDGDSQELDSTDPSKGNAVNESGAPTGAPAVEK
jgi:hypothetical protein